jgi:hypothetical protein
MMKRTLAVVFAVAVLVASTYGWEPGAKTYYVSKSGSDKNPCSQKAPCRTIPVAIAKMKTGDHLVVREGVIVASDIKWTLGRS